MIDEALSSNGSEDKKIVIGFAMKFRSSRLWVRLIHPPHETSNTYLDISSIVKGVFSKPSGNRIVALIFWFFELETSDFGLLLLF